ncbi:MAG: ATP-binding protein [Candidatus Firestonebacteria bacterium]
MQYINRIILDKIRVGFKNNRIIIIIGSRQVGKTTVLEMYKKYISKDYLIFYFNLEDISALSICENFDNLKSYLKDKGADIEKQKIFLIIDEFQYIKNATKLFKMIYDIYSNINILASGSSSIEIQKHLKESLAGRKKVYNMYALSFEEYIKFKSESKYTEYSQLDYHSSSSNLIELYNKDYLGDYLVYGGYPKVTLLLRKTEKIEEIQDIYNSYIQKDIKSLIKGENISTYNNLLKVISSQIGNLVNIHELSNTLKISRREILKYLDILEQTFIIKLIKPFHSNKRSEVSKMPKVYLMDSGIINCSTGNFNQITLRQNLGSYIENFILVEILKYKPVQYEVYFWRTKQGTEIDFILYGDDELIPIEVKWQNLVGPFVPKNFISFFSINKNVKRSIVITKNISAKIHKDGKDIYFIPAILFNKFLKELGGSTL